MKLTVKTSALRSLLGTVGRACGSGRAIPILSHALVSACDGRIEARATDFELSLRSSVPAEVDEPGALTLPAAPLNGLAGNLPDGEVFLSANGNQVMTVTSGFSEYTLRGLPAADFPELPEVPDDACTVRMPGDAWRRLCQSVVYAAATDQTSALLTGVALARLPDGIKAVATDTHRLAVAWATAEVTGAEWPAAMPIVPATAIREAMRLDGEVVTLRIGQQDDKASQIVLTCGETTLTTRLIDGAFPALERVIPRSCGCSITVEREALLACIRRLLGVGADALRLNMTLAGGRLTVRSIAGELGGGVEVLTGEQTGPDPDPWAYNAHYLRDALAALDCAKVRLSRKDSASGAISPGTLLPADGDVPLSVLMPMAVA